MWEREMSGFLILSVILGIFGGGTALVGIGNLLRGGSRSGMDW